VRKDVDGEDRDGCAWSGWERERRVGCKRPAERWSKGEWSLGIDGRVGRRRSGDRPRRLVGERELRQNAFSPRSLSCSRLVYPSDHPCSSRFPYAFISSSYSISLFFSLPYQDRNLFPLSPIERSLPIPPSFLQLAVFSPVFCLSIVLSPLLPLDANDDLPPSTYLPYLASLISQLGPSFRWTFFPSPSVVFQSSFCLVIIIPFGSFLMLE
jgi:hypothetical protein